MSKFAGFTDHETFTRLPDSFFRDLLATIDDAGELKVTLFALWRFEHMESRIRFLRLDDFAALLPDPADALEKAVQRGSLIKACPPGDDALYFLNSPRGRAAAAGYEQGKWSSTSAASVPPPEVPNIFRLYEENIGALTPLIADALKDAEAHYQADWIAEAMDIAVRSNKRSWRYVEAILKRWKEEGHAQDQDRRNVEGPRGRDVARKVDDFLKR